MSRCGRMSRGSRCARLSRCHRGCCHIGRVGFGRFRVRIIHILTLFLDPSVVNVARCGRAHLNKRDKTKFPQKAKRLQTSDVASESLSSDSYDLFLFLSLSLLLDRVMVSPVGSFFFFGMPRRDLRLPFRGGAPFRSESLSDPRLDSESDQRDFRVRLRPLPFRLSSSDSRLSRRR